jgi:hypothetical protein
MLYRVVVIDIPGSTPNKSADLPGEYELDSVDDRGLPLTVGAEKHEALAIQFEATVRQTAKMLKPNGADQLTHS